MTEAIEILSQIQDQGLKVELRSGVLFVGPRERVTDDLRDELKTNMPNLLAHFAAGSDGDVQWRVAAMLAQLLPLSWPCTVPTLCADANALTTKQDCASCGEIRNTGEGDSYICGPCARAKAIALELWMQRPAQNVKTA
jgi:hypothetical protein